MVAGAIAAILAIAGGMTWLLLKAMHDNPELAQATNCPETGAASITAIVVDRTDPLSPVARADVRARLLDQARSVPRFGKLVLFGAGADEVRLLAPAFDRCNPGSANSGSELTSNPVRVQARYEREYLRPFELEVDRLLEIEAAPQSPIVEGIQAVTVTAFPPGSETIPRRLVVVSDLLQNSRRLSMYRGDLSSPAIEDFGANLTGVHVELLVIERDQEHALQSSDDFLAFWTGWFTRSGALVRGVVRLAGRN